MIRLVDITFHANNEYADTAALLKAQQASLFYIEAIRNKLQVQVIKHVSAGTAIIEKEPVKFFIGKNKRGYIAKETIAYLKKIHPDVIIIHGLGFPLQIMRLKMILGKKTKLIAWHHAEQPARWPGKIMYWLADKCISRYLFTSQGNAAGWIDAGIIGHQNKVAELPPTLTVFKQFGKTTSRQQTGMDNGIHYLWVGRLAQVKDPLTVIDAFAQFVSRHPAAKLHMIFRGGELLQVIENRLQQDPALCRNIFLHGAVANDMLPAWYSAADFFISSSLREAGSVTILEAMACGCLPIVTAIPASLKVTGNGEYGLLYEAGNAGDLVKTLVNATMINKEIFAEKTRGWFAKEFSVEAVAGKLLAVCESVMRK
jgi:glycosyltransferase involved in cell wall biosynthesis